MNNRHLGLINPGAPQRLINAENKYQERLINATKKQQLGVILGVILGVPKSAPGLRGSKSVAFD